MKNKIVGSLTCVVLTGFVSLLPAWAAHPRHVHAHRVDSTTLVKAPANLPMPELEKLKELSAKKAELAKVNTDLAAINANPKIKDLVRVTKDLASQNKAVDELKAPGDGASNGDITAYNSEVERLNKWGKDLDAEKKALLDELMPQRERYDALELRKSRLQADIDSLEKFKLRSDECLKMKSHRALKDCMDRLFDSSDSGIK